MSNTSNNANSNPTTTANPFGSVEQQVRFEQDRARSQAQLNVSITQATRQIKASAAAFVNPITRLKESILRLDESNRNALRLGTTTEKLTNEINKNSNVIKQGLVSNQKLVDAIALNYESGVRVQTDEMMNLTVEMIATGQDLRALTAMNSDLMLFTGDNTNSLERVNKVNREVSDKYGVSNDKLIASVNSLRDVFEEASFFGADTTDSLMALTTELKGRAGGKNVESAIKTLIQLGTGGLETLPAAMLTGAQGLRQQISSGGAVGMSDIIPILQNVAGIAQQSGGGNMAIGADIAAARTGLSKAQVNQLLQLNMQLEKNYTLDESMKKTQDETFNNIKNINERAINFYDKTAVKSLGYLGSLNTSVLSLIAQGAMAGGAFGGAMGGIRRNSNETRAAFGARKNAARKAFLGQGRRAGTTLGLGAAAMLAGSVGGPVGSSLQSGLGGASLGFAIGGPIGAAIGGLAGATIPLLTGILDSNQDQSKAAKDRLKMERDRENMRRTQEAASEAKRAQFLLGYLRSRSAIDFKENKEALNTIIQLLGKANIQRSGVPRTTRPEGGR